VRPAGRFVGAFVISLLLLFSASLDGQSNATLQGRVFDSSGAALPGATIRVNSDPTGFDRSAQTDAEGRYQIEAIPAGSYDVSAGAAGFRSEFVATLNFEVGRTLVRDFRLEVGDRRETVVVIADTPLIDRASAVVGHVVTPQTIQEIPLNGRHFMDLGLLGPGSVAPSQNGFSAMPVRGQGAYAINTAGNREEAVGFLINGVTANNLTFGALLFEPPVASVQEFKIDNSVFSAEYGHVSGAVVNIVTRSGSDDVHFDVLGFLRNDALDARNFFEFTSPDPHPFERYNFEASVGGPLVRGKTHFFATYDILRQRQGLDMNSLVLSDEQRAATADPVIRRLIDLIPRANFVDADGTPRFVGAAAAAVDMDRWTIDLRHNLGHTSYLHGYFGWQRTLSTEPASRGTTIPGFGHLNRLPRSLLTLEHTHVFGPALLNEARFSRSDLEGKTVTVAQLNPADFGIQNGVVRPIGLPQITVAGGLSFGGPFQFPQGRRDGFYLFTDTVSGRRGRHSVRVGGEYRHFDNQNFSEGTGSFNFPSVASFLAGTANAFSITLGERSNHIDQRAVAFFGQDRITVGSTLTLDLGLRYEWHVTPTERNNQFVVFDPGRASLLRVGVDIDDIHRQNNRNVEPRVGIAWTPSSDGRTVVRAAYGSSVDEPSTTAVRDTATNPPFGTPLAAAGSIPLDSAIGRTAAGGLAPATIDHGFRNASLRSWNVNVQRQVARDFAAMVGYFGSLGRDLRISRNLNQPVNGVRPFALLSPSSPILPGTPLGNITQVESTGFSSYHALWLSTTKRLSRGLLFDASYTWSKSLDTNSLNSSGFAVQDSYDIPDQYGLSDYDARHRFIVSATYALPFTGHWATRGWQASVIVQSQSGNPVNIVTSNSTLNGTPNTVRPDVIGPIRVIGSVDQWFDTSAFVAAGHFGNLGRNLVIGPPFHNTDLSINKNGRVGDIGVQFRVDIFDLFNHPNFGPPGNIVGSPTFGKITRTRFSTGEGGSSRQIQLGVKLSF
jgi:outer membrane receptor protein involved in Fe transport